MKIPIKDIITEATAQKKFNLLKDAKINFTNAKNFVTRNLKDSKGNLLKDKELVQAKIKLGLPSNNDLQMIRSNMRKFGDKELGFQKLNNKFEDSSKIIGDRYSVESFGSASKNQLHTHPNFWINSKKDTEDNFRKKHFNSLPSGVEVRNNKINLDGGSDVNYWFRRNINMPAGTNFKETVVSNDGVSVSNIKRLNKEKIFHPKFKYLDNMDKLSKIRIINFEK